MRRLRVLGGILVAAAVLFPASAAPRANVLSNVFKLPLPAPKTGAVYEVDVKLGLPPNVNITGTSGAPFSLSVTNTVPSYIRVAAKVLPGAKPNTFKLLVAINAPKGKVRRLAGDATADLQLNTFPPFTSATATPQAGDKCADLKANEGKGTDIVGRGGSPNEGKTIEKFTEGADPNCKKGGGTPPPKTTTTTTTKKGPCEATPLPKECRFDLTVEVKAPDDIAGGQVQSIPVTIVVTNEGPADSGPSYVSFSAISPELFLVAGIHLDTLPGCKRPTHTQQLCDVPGLGKGESKTFTTTIRINNQNPTVRGERKKHPRVAFHLRSDVGTTERSVVADCDESLEVTCKNNVASASPILAAPTR